jgi:hypothetical protein
MVLAPARRQPGPARTVGSPRRHGPPPGRRRRGSSARPGCRGGPVPAPADSRSAGICHGWAWTFGSGPPGPAAPRSGSGPARYARSGGSPRTDRRPRSPEPGQYLQHGPVSLLGHAQLPQHERSVKHQARRVPCVHRLNAPNLLTGPAAGPAAACPGLPIRACLSGPRVQTFCTVSRAHLRRAGPDGPGREQRGRTRAVERERAARVTRRRRPGFTRGLAVTGRQLFAASLRARPV